MSAGVGKLRISVRNFPKAQYPRPIAVYSVELLIPSSRVWVNVTDSKLPDTGYDLINLDASIVARYYQDVPGANSVTTSGSYTFPCNASLPDLVLIINGSGATIRGHVLNYHPYNNEANSKHCLRPPSINTLVYIPCGYRFCERSLQELICCLVCMGALQSSGDGGSALFGQAFMMAQFLVLNVGNRSISFAEIAPDLWYYLGPVRQRPRWDTQESGMSR